MSAEPEDWKRPPEDYTYRHEPSQSRIERMIGIMGKPGARTWFVLIVAALYGGLWLFGFDNVMDRLGWTRPEPPPIEMLAAP